MGHDVIIIKVNGDGPLKVGGAGGLDVNLLNSDGPFRGWEKEA